MEKKWIVIKIGGRVATEKSKTEALLSDMARLQQEFSFLLVHGGGAEVTEAASRFGIQSQFVDGIRFTSKEEMAVVDGVLAGKINKELVRLAYRQGLRAVGLSGSDGEIFTGIERQPQSCTGIVTQTQSQLLKLLQQGGYLPVIATTSMTSNGDPLNINADEAALALAVDLKAFQLIYISDIPGVLKNDQVIKNLNGKTIEEEIAAEVISGGMIPKVHSAWKAVTKGVEQVVIGGYENREDLFALIEGNKGTTICQN